MFPDLIVTLIGTALGVVLGLLVDRVSRHQQELKQEVVLLGMILEEVDRHMTEASVMKEGFQEKLLLFDLSTHYLDQALPQLFSLSTDRGLLSSLEMYRLRLHDLASKLSLYRTLFISGGIDETDSRQKLTTSISLELSRLEEQLDVVRPALIERRTNAESDSKRFSIIHQFD